MTQSDPLGDMLTRIRNAAMAGHAYTSMPRSKFKVAVAEVLKQEGYVEDFEVTDDKPIPILRIQLKYTGNRRERKPLIDGLERVSKPGRRIYANRREIPWVQSGMGVVIMSTPKGVMSGQQARRRGIGGEVLAKVW